MEWSQRTKLAEESIPFAFRLEAPLGGAMGHTRQFRSIALRDRRCDLRELGVAADELLREPHVVRAAEGRLRAEALDFETTVHVDELTEGDCNDPLTEIICTGAIMQLALHGESGL